MQSFENLLIGKFHEFESINFTKIMRRMQVWRCVFFSRGREREKALSHFYAHSCHDHENDNKKVNKSVCKGN